MTELNSESKYNKVFDDFINRHELKKDIKDVYDMIKLGLTVKPFLIIKSTDIEYTDSYSLLGLDDNQETLEKFIKEYL